MMKKIWVTVGILLLYRVGVMYPVPGVNYNAVSSCVNYLATGGNSVYEFLNVFGGGALFQLGVLSLGVIPYITASIIIQLSDPIFPKLRALKKDGAEGAAKITQYTRYLTIVLAVLQGSAVVILARTPGAIFSECPDSLATNNEWITAAVMVTALTAGAMLSMWMGEYITGHGVGNGISLIMFVSIVAGVPQQITGMYDAQGVGGLALFGVVTCALIVVVVFVEQGQRRIPIHYQTRLVSQRKGYTSTYLPLKLSLGGVIPIILASSLMSVPYLFSQNSTTQNPVALWIATNLTPGLHMWYIVVYTALIVFFTFFYSVYVFNPIDVADDLNKDGGFVPGVRPGNNTAVYLGWVSTRLLTVGAVYLASVSLAPTLIYGAGGSAQSFLYSGTSILILVAVALDSVKQYSSQRKTVSHPASYLLPPHDDGEEDDSGVKNFPTEKTSNVGKTSQPSP